MSLINKKGLPISNGIAIAHIHHLSNVETIILDKEGKGVEYEETRLKEAIEQAKNELQTLIRQSKDRLGEDQAMIFTAQAMTLDDPTLQKSIWHKIRDKGFNAPFAFRLAMSEMMDLLSVTDNLYIRERINDLKDISSRVIRILTNDTEKKMEFIDDVILVTDELTPSETMNLDTKHIKGIITAIGSNTSHSAILANHLGIPAVSGVDIKTLPDHELAIIDGKTGDIFVDPDIKTLTEYKRKQSELLSLKLQFQNYRFNDAYTKDHHRVKVYANIGEPNDLEHAKNSGAEGIGLLRTENQYMQTNTFPKEDELFKFYHHIALGFKDADVVIRTLDIGGDKNLSYLNNRNELNPFLGNRAIRYSLQYPTLFKTQLKAILRANTNHNVQIMFPMIATIEEFRKAKELVLEAQQELESKGIHTNLPKIGIMVEIPSAALFIEEFAKVVDFVSIGTNDLIQYLFAADRTNDHVAYLYQPYHPIVLKTIKNMIDCCHKHGIIVSVCGEMASRIESALILVGFGIDELSMNANSIAEIKYKLSLVNFSDLQELTNNLLDQTSNDEVYKVIHQFAKKLL